MWALYVFGSLALIITVFLLSDICIDIAYDKEFLIKVGLWRANTIVFPEYRKKKTKKRKEKPKEKKPEVKEKDEQKSFNLHELAGQLKTLLKLLGESLTKARLKPCKIHIIAATDDAAKTAILYGTFCAGLTAIQVMFNELFGQCECDFSVLWDYEGKKTSVEADLKIRIRILWILAILRPILFRFIANPDQGLEAALTPGKKRTRKKSAKKSVKAK